MSRTGYLTTNNFHRTPSLRSGRICTTTPSKVMEKVSSTPSTTSRPPSITHLSCQVQAAISPSGTLTFSMTALFQVSLLSLTTRYPTPAPPLPSVSKAWTRTIFLSAQHSPTRPQTSQPGSVSSVILTLEFVPAVMARLRLRPTCHPIRRMSERG